MPLRHVKECLTLLGPIVVPIIAFVTATIVLLASYPIVERHLSEQSAFEQNWSLEENECLQSSSCDIDIFDQKKHSEWVVMQNRILKETLPLAGLYLTMLLSLLSLVPAVRKLSIKERIEEFKKRAKTN